MSSYEKKCRPVSETINNLRNASKQNHQISLFSEMPANSKNSDQPDSQTCQQTANIQISLILRLASNRKYSDQPDSQKCQQKVIFQISLILRNVSKSEHSNQPDSQKCRQKANIQISLIFRNPSKKRIFKSAYFSEMPANSEYSDQPPSKQPIFKSV